MTDFYYYDPKNALNPANYENPLINPYLGLFNFDLGFNKPISYSNPEIPTMEYTDNILDELMEKPFFFKDINEKNADIKMTNDNDYSILLPNDDKFLIDSDKKLKKGNEEYLMKKKFYDIFTDLFNKELLEEDQNKIHKFQYIIINSFQKAFESYRRRYNLKKEDLFFHYKGGTTMKIVYEKYKQIYLNPNIPDIDKYFSRSDSDYQINMKNNLPNFNFHFYNLNKITYNLMNRLKIYFNNHYKEFFNLDMVDRNKIVSIIMNANEKLESNKNQNPDNIYNNIRRFVGCQVLDRFYYNIDGVENFIIDENRMNIVDSNFKIYYDDFSKINSRVAAQDFVRKIKPFNENNNNLMDIKRNDFFITKEQKLFSNYDIFYNSINKKDYNYVFQYLNETNKFVDSLNARNVNNFNLHRLKISCALIFETNDNRLGLMLTPSELIDISFPKMNDHKLGRLESYKYQQYTFDTEIGKLNYNGYSLEGFCYDLKLIIFIESSSKPWNDNKYKKRLYRLLLFSLYIIYSMNTTNRLRLIENLRDIFIENVPLDNELKKSNYFKSLYEDVQKVVKQPRSPEKDIYNFNIIEFFDIILTDIPTETLIQDGNIEYLQKYLKYKKKYLLLKKNLLKN
jgi:hypothetical protein